jgi:hypothetical protein
MPERKTATFIVGTLALSLIMGCISVFVALTTARLDLQRNLAAQLPERLSEALRYSFADNQVIAHIDEQLRGDLADIRFDGLLRVLRDCNTELIRVSQQFPERINVERYSPEILVNWSRGSEADQAKFVLDCDLNFPVLIGVNLTLALLLMSCWWLLPLPISSSEKTLRDMLMEHGIPAVFVRQILQKLNSAEFDTLARNRWFVLAMHRYASANMSLDKAMSIVSADPSVCFHHSSHQVVIHGISIALPKTPYFYYAWYAMQRKHHTGDGWILNPAVDRPDRLQAACLITLMENFGGHQKAVNDLKENGLRSKILDQNRNKIKDELVAALGDELASGFLFETERDIRSSRYRYRLCCDPLIIFMTSASS